MHRLQQLRTYIHGRQQPSRRVCTTATSKWRVAIVGSGPSGFYTADHLLKADPDVQVDIFERLPVPFGLVRHGVAPDHQDVKNVTSRFEQIADESRCGYFGNVHVGQLPQSSPELPTPALVPLAAMRDAYDAVVLAYGAASDRSLGVPGEALRGVSPARRFVEWYNGHPEAVSQHFDLSGSETAVIIGNGNVAVDCARVLCKNIDELASSDIAEHAVETLRSSSIKRVFLIGRRAPLQAAFTIKELRELTKLDKVATRLEAPGDAFSDEVVAIAAADRGKKRLFELIKGLPRVEEVLPESHKEIRLLFQQSPLAFLPSESDETRVGSVSLQATQMIGSPSSSQKAVPIEDSVSELSCDLGLVSVGYSSQPIEGAPFDEGRAVVPSVNGRVEGESGLYVTGWLKRGPSGVILTNVTDAAETAAAIVSDKQEGRLKLGGGGPDALAPVLRSAGSPIVSFSGWLKVDAEERSRGARAQKIRSKVTSIEEMLRIAV